MKTFFYTVFWGCLMLFVTSCSTSTTFTIYGDPGTQILTPNKSLLGTVNSNGTVKIVNSDDDYYAFLISHKPGTEEYIPFALDYKEKSFSGAKMLTGLGLGMASLGIVGLGSGIIALLADDEESAMPLIAISGALDVLGIGIGMPADARSKQTNHEYRYKYLSVQKTNQDIQMTMPVLEESIDRKFFHTDDGNISTHQEDITTSSASSKSNKSISSSSSTKTLKDNAAKIEGAYIGVGTLTQGNEVIEKYTDITISMKRKSKDIVLVNVIESNGEKFFTHDGEYTIHKQNDGKYLLTLEGISTATIEVDVDNNIVYLHPRVNIDNEIFKLSITASKK